MGKKKKKGTLGSRRGFGFGFGFGCDCVAECGGTGPPLNWPMLAKLGLCLCCRGSGLRLLSAAAVEVAVAVAVAPEGDVGRRWSGSDGSMKGMGMMTLFVVYLLFVKYGFVGF